MARRQTLLPVLVLLAGTWACCWCGGGAFVSGGASREQRRGGATSEAPAQQAGIARTSLAAAARAADDGDSEADTVEVGGLSGFVVGLALLPYVGYALVSTFNIAFRGESFAAGPYGLELISYVVSL
ncbi:unnamed protein product, partial [Polarella glacialis]